MWMDVGGRSLLCATAAPPPPKLAIRNPKTRNSQLKNSQFSIACGDNS